jgi:hypothetical protein
VFHVIMYELRAKYDIVFVGAGRFIGVCHRRGRDSQGAGACWISAPRWTSK